MLERAMTELTGKPNLVEAVRMFVHPADKVCVKINGIALANMGTNKELVLPFLQAMIDSGVKPQNITVLEQYGSFLAGTRVNAQNVPAGVQVTVHNNSDATMDELLIQGTGVSTKFVRALTESTAAINFSLIKDHGICGYTGCLKNMTHGCQILPHYFHTHHASPQIALLYAQDVVKSRVRLNITDGFKLMADGGPLWRQPRYVFPHETPSASISSRRPAPSTSCRRWPPWAAPPRTSRRPRTSGWASPTVHRSSSRPWPSSRKTERTGRREGGKEGT
jgi:hypothetical protein